jgi:nicotinamide mononucleotide transporter
MLNVAFSLWGSPVTWLEVLAFVLAVLCVVGNVFEIHWAWPFTIASSALYAWLFYVSKLYGDAGLQFMFIAVAFWGWWQWRRGTRAFRPLRVARLPRNGWLGIVLVWSALWLAIAYALARFTDTDVAWWDAFVTAGSIVGQLLLARKWIENWPVWVAVNAAAVGLFVHKALYLTAVLYALFLLMAVWGWRVWLRRAP